MEKIQFKEKKEEVIKDSREQCRKTIKTGEDVESRKQET